MSEISWLRERATTMRAAMECTDLSDAIDAVLDHLSSVETSRLEALARAEALKGECDYWRANAEPNLTRIQMSHAVRVAVLSDAIDAVLDHLSSVETSRLEALARVAVLDDRVAVLQGAARKVCFEPLGKRRATCDSEALMALGTLVGDQSGEGGSDG